MGDGWRSTGDSDEGSNAPFSGEAPIETGLPEASARRGTGAGERGGAGFAAHGALTALVDALAQPALLLSADGCIVHANAIARRLFLSPPSWHARQAPLPPWVRRIPLSDRGGLLLEVVDPVCDSIEHAPDAPWAVRAELPPRLARMAACLLQGLSDKAAAQALGVSHDTARTYAQQLLRAVGVSTRGELAALVRRWMSG